MSFVPDDIVKMLAAGPGRYVVTNDPLIRRYVRVEVDEQGKVHQLKEDGVTRDGLLSKDGWLTQVKVFTESEAEHEGKMIPRLRRIGTNGMDLPEVLLQRNRYSEEVFKAQDPDMKDPS